MRQYLLLAAFCVAYFAASAFYVSGANAAPKCFKPEEAKEGMFKHGFRPFSISKSRTGRQLIKWVNPKNKTWWEFAMRNGLMCVIDAGGEFERAKPYTPKGDPA